MAQLIKSVVGKHIFNLYALIINHLILFQRNRLRLHDNG